MPETVILGRYLPDGSQLRPESIPLLAAMRGWCEALEDPAGERFGSLAWQIAEQFHDEGLSNAEIVAKFVDMTGRTTLIPLER